MAQITDLKDLLKHEILDLYSAEEQIIEALPKMVEKATNTDLKKALSDHLKVTELQKNRLDDIKGLMGDDEEEGDPEKKGFFSKLFGGSQGEKCKGTEGLIKEGEKMMGEDMTEEVMDAAIIGAAQKIEHYEISGYGTAAAYARELGLNDVAGLLQQTLDEEYAADDSLTKLAVGKLNIEAENATPTSSKESSPGAEKSKGASTSKSSRKNNSSKPAPSKSAPFKKVSASKSKGAKVAAKKSPSKVAGKKSPLKKSPSKVAAKKSPAKKSPSKVAAKKSPAKKSPSKKSASPVNRSAAKSAAKKGAKKSSANNSKAGKKASSKRR